MSENTYGHLLTLGLYLLSVNNKHRVGFVVTENTTEKIIQ